MAAMSTASTMRQQVLAWVRVRVRGQGWGQPVRVRARVRVRVGIRVRVRVLEAAGAGLGREPPCPGLLRLAEQREGRPGVPGQD